jgi:pyruvate kinase
MQDLSGPKIRTGELATSSIILQQGRAFTLTTKPCVGDATKVSVSYKRLPSLLKKGDVLKLDDGTKSLRVTSVHKQEIHTKVLIGGVLTAHKGINIPGKSATMPSLTNKDKRDVLFGIKNKVDFIALSFVSSAKDILALRRLLQRHSSTAQIIAKIETAAAVQDFDNILSVADAIMVARGDLAIEVGVEKVPNIQKSIITKCNKAGKPVITATEMLESMTHSPTPTRAEVSDVANAVADGTDALMLSAETATGEHPELVISTMQSIASYADNNHNQKLLSFTESSLNTLDAITHSAVRLATNTDASYIVTLTSDGETAQMLSRFRPTSSIIALSHNKSIIRKLLLSYACVPLLLNAKPAPHAMMRTVRKLLKSKLNAKSGEHIVLLLAPEFMHNDTATLSLMTL